MSTEVTTDGELRLVNMFVGKALNTALGNQTVLLNSPSLAARCELYNTFKQIHTQRGSSGRSRRRLKQTREKEPPCSRPLSLANVARADDTTEMLYKVRDSALRAR